MAFRLEFQSIVWKLVFRTLAEIASSDWWRNVEQAQFLSVGCNFERAGNRMQLIAISWKIFQKYSISTNRSRVPSGHVECMTASGFIWYDKSIYSKNILRIFFIVRIIVKNGMSFKNSRQKDCIWEKKYHLKFMLAVRSLQSCKI